MIRTTAELTTARVTRTAVQPPALRPPPPLLLVGADDAAAAAATVAGAAAAASCSHIFAAVCMTPARTRQAIYSSSIAGTNTRCAVNGSRALRKPTK